MAPTVNEIEKTWGGKVSFVVFHLKNPKYYEMAQKANIRAIPTMHFYKGGKMLKELVGSLPRNVIEDELKKISN